MQGTQSRTRRSRLALGCVPGKAALYPSALILRWGLGPRWAPQFVQKQCAWSLRQRWSYLTQGKGGAEGSTHGQRRTKFKTVHTHASCLFAQPRIHQAITYASNSLRRKSGLLSMARRTLHSPLFMDLPDLTSYLSPTLR